MYAQILGTTDEVTTCQCCGREGLKKTVALDTGDGIVYFGETCAAKALGRTSKEIRAFATSADAETANIMARVRRQDEDTKAAIWFAFLESQAPGLNSEIERIEALGGFRAARTLFATETRSA